MSSPAVREAVAGFLDWQSHSGRREVMTLAAFVVVLIAVAGILEPNFLRRDNMRDVLIQAAPLGFVVIGQTLVILVRGLDLSIASVTASAAVLATAFNTDSNAMIPVIALSGIGLGAAVGLVNGLLVTKRQISPFLATLAVMIALQGIRFAYTKGVPSGTLPDGIAYMAAGAVGGVPISIIVLAVVALAISVMLARTPFGRRLYLLGSNPNAARLIGIRMPARVALAYVASGVLAAIAGLFLAGYVGYVDNWTGRGLELESIAAAILGGASLRGGKATVMGSLLGALILVMLFNIMLMLGLPIEFQLVVQGLVIVAAAALYAAGGSRD